MKAGIGVAILIAALRLTSAADAAVVTKVGDSVYYVALPFETSHVVVSRSANGVVLDDSGSNGLLVAAAPGCTATSARVIQCDGAAKVHMSLGDGNDSVVVHGAVPAWIDGGSGNDVLRGGSAADDLYGGPGDDVLDGGGGADLLDGGAGIDTADYSSRTAGVTVTLDGHPNDGELREGDDAISIERVLGGSGDDTLIGGSGDDELDGGPGNDVIDGGGGNDILNGGPGDDVLIGGPGNDTENGGDGNDALAGDGGADTLDGGPGSDGINALDPVPAPDLVDCGTSSDRVFGDAEDAIRSDCESIDRTGVLGYTARVGPPAAGPELGKTVVLKPITGTVLVTPPPSGSSPNSQQKVPALPPVPLDDERNLPVGTVVDTRLGRVALTIAVDRKGTTNSGQFYTGSFQVFQQNTPGAVGDLALRGGKAFGACPASQRGHSLAFASRRRRGGSVRRLWGDAHGAFRTSGRFAAATVRGTQWLTEDRCDGTLIRVARGEVAVRDLRSGRAVTVAAGQQYLVRAR